MPPDKKFDLGGYIEVKDRIAKFYELYAQGRLVTGEVRLSNEPDGVPRVMVQGLAYRSPEDTHPGVGWSWMELPGKTTYTKGSELENTETSAWGRAIGSLGILIDASIASAQEVENKRGGQMGEVIPADPKPTQTYVAAHTEGSGAYVAKPTHDGSLIGVAELAKDFPDFMPKQGPDGMVLAFKLKAQGGIKVIAKGQLAEALVPLRDSIIGQRVSVWGRVRDETFRPKGSTKDVTYAVCDLERIQTADGTLPAPELAEPPDDVPLVGEEAPTAPLFDDVAVA
jgi:hypothetical protein